MLAGGDASLAFGPGGPCAAMEAVTCGAAAPGTGLTMRRQIVSRKQLLIAPA
jgi:hypothetical protein